MYKLGRLSAGILTYRGALGRHITDFHFLGECIGYILLILTPFKTKFKQITYCS